MHHQHRRIVGPASGAQFVLHCFQQGDREENAQRRVMLRQRRQRFALRHWRASGDAGEDDGLGDFRQGQAFHRRRCRGQRRGNPRHHADFDSGGIKRLHHLGQCAVERGVAGLQAYHGCVPLRPFDQPVGDGLQRHIARIGNLAIFACPGERRFGDQRTGVENRPGAFHQFAALDGNQVRVSRPGPDKPDFANRLPSPARGRGVGGEGRRRLIDSPRFF